MKVSWQKNGKVLFVDNRIKVIVDKDIYRLIIILVMVEDKVEYIVKVVDKLLIVKVFVEGQYFKCIYYLSYFLIMQQVLFYIRKKF